jgi:poly-beta-1,6-N-acetyl-D-glucosamine synthase
MEPRRATDALLLAVAAVGPVIYPAWIAAVARRSRPVDAPTPSQWPGLTVVVPAYREGAVIQAKVEDLHANGYPGPLEVVVVADDPETAAVAAGAQALVIAPGERLGKAEALNRGIQAATKPVVVLTDANTTLRRGSLAALARWFDDPAVGAVAGEKQVLASEQGAYWRFESWLKRCESRSGTTVGLVGELAAVRRSMVKPMPANVAVDDLWMALDVIERGGRIRYERDAVATEAASGHAEEWERRTRVDAGMLDIFVRRRGLLAPRNGLPAAQLWGHRVVRISFGPLAHALLLGRSVRYAGSSRIHGAFLGLHLLAGLMLWRRLKGRPLGPAGRVASQILFLQATALGGLVRFARKEPLGLWPKADRSAAL